MRVHKFKDKNVTSEVRQFSFSWMDDDMHCRVAGEEGEDEGFDCAAQRLERGEYQHNKDGGDGEGEGKGKGESEGEGEGEIVDEPCSSLRGCSSCVAWPFKGREGERERERDLGLSHKKKGTKEARTHARPHS